MPKLKLTKIGSREIPIAIIDYSGSFISIQIFEEGIFQGQAQKIPNEYRYYNRHYNFRDDIAYMTIFSELLGHDNSYRGSYDKNDLEPLSINFDDYQILFENQPKIQKLVDNIEFVKRKTRKRR